jgi:hypothetical protein
LDGGQGTERDDKDARVECGDFVLAGAQLCDMLAAGYSAKMTEKDQQGVIAAFENFVEADLLAGDGGQGEVGGGFHVEGLRLKVGKWQVLSGGRRPKSKDGLDTLRYSTNDYRFCFAQTSR